MAVKASISSGYRWRLGIIAIALLAFGGWFLYDAAVKYPARKHIYETRIQLEQDHPEQWRDLWIAEVEANGWPENPKAYTDRDIFIQYLCAALTLPLGLVFGIAFVRAGRRWIAADEQGLHTSWGQHAPWESLRRVDKTRWKTKGIAVVHYQANAGEQRITLDDWKYDRDPTVAILKQVDDQFGESDAEPAPAAASTNP
ncbi:MAG: hypothetical protein WD151_15625 [Phycisphaeraceae bacterium]